MVDCIICPKIVPSFPSLNRTILWADLLHWTLALAIGLALANGMKMEVKVCYSDLRPQVAWHTSARPPGASTLCHTQKKCMIMKPLTVSLSLSIKTYGGELTSA